MTNIVLKYEINDQYEPIITCNSCKKQVPKTNLCINCGAPILYNKNFFLPKNSRLNSKHNKK